VQFYILAPLLALVFAIPSVLGRRSLLIGGILAASVLAELALWKTESLINYIQYFLTGFLLVDIYLNKWEKLPPRSFSYDLFSGAALLALFSVGIMTSYYGLLIPWLTMLVIMGGFRGKLFNRFFTNPWIYTIGGMCYTIYLYHFFIIGFLGHGRLFLFHSFWPDLLVSFVAVPLAIVGVSSILFLLFEKPFMRRNWHSNLLTKWKCARGVPQDQEVASG
jgi:peptidoglycan/LPS O-acetylase OafA/YrhL